MSAVAAIISGAAGAAAGAGINAAVGNNSGGGGGGGGGGMPWWLQSLFSIFGGLENQRATAEANDANDLRYGQGLNILLDALSGSQSMYDENASRALDVIEQLRESGTEQGNALADQIQSAYDDRRSGVLGSFDQSGQDVLSGYGSGLGQFLDQLSGRNTGIQGGYADRYRTAEEDISNYGRQASEDINRGFENTAGRVQQDLISRGLGSSTVAGNELLGVEERRSAEQRRLGEDLLRARINTLSGLSGEALSARERMSGQQAGYEYGGLGNAFQQASNLQSARAALDAALRGDTINSQAQLGTWNIGNQNNYGMALADMFNQIGANRANMYSGGMGNIANAIFGRNDMATQISPSIFSQLGANAARNPQYPSSSPWASFGSAFAQPFGQAIGTGFNNWLNPPAGLNSPQMMQNAVDTGDFMPIGSGSYQPLPPNGAAGVPQYWNFNDPIYS